MNKNIVEVSKKAFSNLWRFQDAKSAHDFFNNWNKEMKQAGRKSRVYYEIVGKKPTVMVFARVEKEKPDSMFYDFKGYQIKRKLRKVI